MTDRKKPEPLWTAKVGNCDVAGYDFGNQQRKTDKPKQGESVFLLCPICHSEEATLCPIVQVDRAGKTHVVHFMCCSDQCDGDTIVDVHKGVVSENVRILDPDDLY